MVNLHLQRRNRTAVLRVGMGGNIQCTRYSDSVRAVRNTTVESATPNMLLYDRQYESHMAKNAGTWPRKPENVPPQSYTATSVQAERSGSASGTSKIGGHTPGKSQSSKYPPGRIALSDCSSKYPVKAGLHLVYEIFPISLVKESAPSVCHLDLTEGELLYLENTLSENVQ